MLAIDHLVVVSEDPEKDAQQFVEQHNVIAIEGGRHEKWGTYNFLSYFQNDSYIEWLGVFDEALARKSNLPLVKKAVEFLDQGKRGPLTFALRTEHLDKYLNNFEEKNIPYGGPYPGMRKRLDGSTLSWRMLFPEKSANLPFLIEWGSVANKPDDAAKINPANLGEITIPGDSAIYKDVFQLTEKDYTVQLENGKLRFTNDQLDFKLSE
ncbi:VOC family protein [Oceanobacillus alkalisoli]|uniref:VOC family protein n=1 Tax=Oceanobacillus alkalisoli TaxID=2925113 RepID=UPI001EE47910|nr:VOC family protein [Oceanobacillus alkalisoli]MCG5104814.1 VOC family protein [Oceanobacillus alkalisoli]